MDALQKTIKNLPHSPGVYIYKDNKGGVLYAGKARDISSRVRQYFVAPSRLSEKTRHLVSRIHSIRIIQVASEFEAVLLEAKCIRYYEPKYNVIAKDDKSPVYIHIQNPDTLPRVFLSRKPKNLNKNDTQYFGPFPTTRTALTILRSLRHSIPFCQQKIRNGSPCFYTHLGLCNPCPSIIEKMKDGKEKKKLSLLYKKNVKRLLWILSGRSQKTFYSFQKEMQSLSRQNKFEEAAVLRDQIHALIQIINSRYDPFLFEESDKLEKIPLEQLNSLRTLLLRYYPAMKPLHRIECYDISSMQGTSSVGSMVVCLDGIPAKDQYRKFKIIKTYEKSDVAMMEEVMKRRFNHTEWTFPTLIVVDGGKGQVSRVSSVLAEIKIPIPVIGLTKRFERIVLLSDSTFYTVTIPLTSGALQLLQHLRDEAHRFAISYHTILRGRLFSLHP